MPTVKNHQEFLEFVIELIGKELAKINDIQRIEMLQEIIDIRFDHKKDILVTVEKEFVNKEDIQAIEKSLHQALEDQFSADEDIWVTNTDQRFTKIKLPIAYYLQTYLETGIWE